LRVAPVTLYRESGKDVTMNDDNITACILFAKSQGLAVADEATTDYAQLRAAVGRLEGERDRMREALEKIASGELCDNDGRGCNNEDVASAALAADERGTE
jgi:hypothetical protein